MKLLLLNLFSLFLFSQNIQLFNCELEYSKDPLKTVKKKYFPAKEIILNSKKNLAYRYRLAIDVRNLADKPIEAIVFRYSLSIKTKKNLSDEGSWNIPYYVDEIRISKLLPKQSKKIYINNLNLTAQLVKYYLSDFKVEAVKIEIMKEPKKEDKGIEILTYIFPIKEI